MAEKGINTKRSLSEFLKQKNIEISIKRYLIDALSYMALGLFSSLLIGTIIQTFGEKLGIEAFVEIATLAKGATGAAMGVAISYALQSPPLVMFSVVTVGMAGNALGGPVGTLISVIIATEIGKIVSKETKIDIIVTPAVTIITGVFVAQSIGPVVSSIMTKFGEIIMSATVLQPLFMGMLVSLLVGIALTLPISSAAICIMLELSGLAAGAATAGCCAQMIGFAVMSFKENGWGGLLAQGFGTSMLQMGNIIKNPKIWIPPILTSLITGPIATVIFRLENIPTGAGMGTSGLVGQFGIYAAMPNGGLFMWVGIVMVCFVLPAILTYIFAKILRKMNWIKEGDLKLDL